MIPASYSWEWTITVPEAAPGTLGLAAFCALFALGAGAGGRREDQETAGST